MATNEVFKVGDYISVNVGADIPSGRPFAVGTLVGVLTTGTQTSTSIDSGGNLHTNRYGVGNQTGYASVALDGAFRVPVAAGTAYAVGDLVYVTAATGVISKTSGGNVPFGKVVAEPKASTSGAGEIVVKIVQ
jgi:predicted RecA/RadA family phage recombinase